MTEHQKGESVHEEAERIAVFAGIVATAGPETITDILDTAAANREKGLKGAAITSDDMSLQLVVDTEVSFRLDDAEPRKIPIELARQITADVMAAQQPEV